MEAESNGIKKKPYILAIGRKNIESSLGWTSCQKVIGQFENNVDTAKRTH